jgi:hypothetical protein
LPQQVLIEQRSPAAQSASDVHPNDVQTFAPQNALPLTSVKQ